MVTPAGAAQAQHGDLTYTSGLRDFEEDERKEAEKLILQEFESLKRNYLTAINTSGAYGVRMGHVIDEAWNKIEEFVREHKKDHPEFQTQMPIRMRVSGDPSLMASFKYRPKDGSSPNGCPMQ